MKIIKHRERVEVVTYSRSFEYEDMPGAGFGFNCDAQGVVDELKLQPCALDAYHKCLSNTMTRMDGVEWRSGDDGWDPVPNTGHAVSVKMIDNGVVKHEHAYNEPAVGECVCGEHITLHGFTNTCGHCGRDYNSAGQLLAPRSQWGEETGESVSDILMADVDLWGGE